MKAHPSPRQLPQGDDHARRRPSVGDDVHDAGGIELHGQHLHGDPPEFLGLLVHLPGLLLIRLINLQGSQALEIFQEAVPQLCVNAPVFCQQAPGKLLHRHNGYRDEGHADKEHKAGSPADKGEDGKQSHRRQEAVEKLGQISAEIGLQLLHSLRRHLHHLRRGCLLPVGGSQTEELLIDPVPQDPLHIHAGPVGGKGGLPVTDKPQGNGAQGQTAPCKGRGGGHPPEDCLLQQHGHAACHQNLAEEREPLPEHLKINVFLCLGQKPQESLLNHRPAPAPFHPPA